MTPKDRELNIVLDAFAAREESLGSVPRAREYFRRVASDRAVGQRLLAIGEEDVPQAPVTAREHRPVNDWSAAERELFLRGLDAEHQALGFYLSASPLDLIHDQVVRLSTGPLSEVFRRPWGGTVRLAGVVSSLDLRRTRDKRPYARFVFSDPTGCADAVAWAETVEKLGGAGLKNGAILFVRAHAQQPPLDDELEEGDKGGQNLQLTISDAYTPDDADVGLARVLAVTFADRAALEAGDGVLRSLLGESDSLHGCTVARGVPGVWDEILWGYRAWVGKTDLEALRGLPGVLAVHYLGAHPLR